MGYLSCRAGSATAVISTAAAGGGRDLASETAASEQNRSPKLKRFSHRELEAATGGFSVENLLGRGSHGSVYRAVVGGKRVAVKKGRETSREFENEIEILSKIRSPKFVNLLGFSIDESRNRLLVVEFMSNGTLYDMLHSNSNSRAWLNWGRRINVALQIAKAVQVLHSQNPPVIHRDIKSANVLMDKNLVAKLGDFGLAIRCNTETGNHKPVPPAGTIGYLDPDYVTPDTLSTKTDVFSFGILLLEIITGRRPIDVGYSPAFVVDWAIPLVKKGKTDCVYDEKIGPPKELDVRRQLVLVAAKCVKFRRERRPEMEEVVCWLNGLSKSVKINRWDGLGIGNSCMVAEVTGKPVELARKDASRLTS